MEISKEELIKGSKAIMGASWNEDDVDRMWKRIEFDKKFDLNKYFAITDSFWGDEILLRCNKDNDFEVIRNTNRYRRDNCMISLFTLKEFNQLEQLFEDVSFEKKFIDEDELVKDNFIVDELELNFVKYYKGSFYLEVR